jgi:hypothetical protein
MAQNPWQDDSFLEQTAARHGWQCSADAHRSYVLRHNTRGLSWICTARRDDFGDDGPEAAVDWLCPQLAITDADVRRVLRDLGDNVTLPVPQLHIRYDEPRTELGTLIDMARRFRQGGLKGLVSETERELRVDDTAGIIDEGLLARLRRWPDAFDANGRPGPARLGYLRIEPAGFRVRSSGWWASGAALAHHIELGVDLGLRLLPHFRHR